MKDSICKILIWTLVVTTSSIASADALDRAHTAYVNSEYEQMASELKEVMFGENYSEIERENALKLYNKAMSDSGHLPSDWRLPSTIKKLKVGIKRTNSEGSVRFTFIVKGDTTRANVIDQLQIIKYPDQIILDKQAEVYDEWENEIWDGIPEFKSESVKQREQFEVGLYLINIDTHQGEKVRGWFLITDENSTDTPQVFSPGIEEVVTGPSPVVKFGNFTSPEYQGYEYRSLWVGLTKVFDQGWKFLWGHYEGSPKRTELVLGAASEHSIEPVKLEPARYWLTVSFTESKKFGDLVVQRESRTARSFFVK